MVSAILVILAALILATISPAMGQAVTASSSGIWTAVSGTSYYSGVGTKEVRWGQPAESLTSGMRFDGQSISSNFGQEFCLGTLTHYNYPIYYAASGATLKVTLAFTNPSLGSVPFTYIMSIDETPNEGTCGSCAYSPCELVCPDKISWPSTPPADQTFTIGGEKYTLQIVGIKSACPGGTLMPYFITQEKKSNVGYLVGRIICVSKPDAIDDTYSTTEDTPLTVPATGVLGNDIDVDGDDLDVLSYTQPSNGMVTINAEDGSLTYTPNANFCGTDTFTYTITDDDGNTDTATVTITVTCVNEFPVANDDTAATVQNQPVSSSVIANDVLSGDGGNTWSKLTDPAHGTVVFNPDGSYTYTPSQDWCGSTDSFTYQICDVNGDCDPATVTITVTCECVNNPGICNDNNVCTDDSCDPTSGCVYTNDDTNICADGDVCDGVETCSNGVCQDGTPLVCSDNNVCNGVETCDPATGCTNPDDLVCDDEQFCNGLETCDPVAGCQDGADPVVDDGIACTDDSCDETSDQVVHTPVDSRCSDNNVCNGVETCDPATGCTNPDDLVCDDEQFCNGLETCDPVAGCQDGAAPDCGDGVDCTTDACNEQTDSCENTPDDSVCDDDNACTSNTCDPVDGCIFEQLNYADGDLCTIDYCDPATGDCTYTPVICNDADACTTDTCDSATGDCIFTDISDTCDDGSECTTDTCDATMGCINTEISCNDGDACTTDTCDPATGCVFTDITCDDGDVCTVDTCDSELGCVFTPILLVANDDPDEGAYGAIYGKTLTVAALNGVLANDEYDGTGTLTAVLNTGPSHGTLTLKADGSFTYKPSLSFVGTDTFTYKAFDGNCYSDPATVKILVAKCPWSLKGELYEATCNVTLEIPEERGILANDPTALYVVNPENIVLSPNIGSITVEPDGSFVYEPPETVASTTAVFAYYTAWNGVCESYKTYAKIVVTCPCK